MKLGTGFCFSFVPLRLEADSTSNRQINLSHHAGPCLLDRGRWWWVPMLLLLPLPIPNFAFSYSHRLGRGEGRERKEKTRPSYVVALILTGNIALRKLCAEETCTPAATKAKSHAKEPVFSFLIYSIYLFPQSFTRVLAHYVLTYLRYSVRAPVAPAAKAISRISRLFCFLPLALSICGF